jgi:hypothetical protein
LCSGLTPALLPLSKNLRSPLWAKLRITKRSVTHNVIGSNDPSTRDGASDWGFRPLRQIYRQLQVILEDEVAVLGPPDAVRAAYLVAISGKRDIIQMLIAAIAV